MEAVLVCIGDEILSGNTVDTNTGFIAKQLRLIGISVRRVIAIPDDKESIFQTLDLAFSLGDLVISTGGLGPTNDDKTALVLSQYFGCSLVEDQQTLRHLKSYLESKGKEYLFEINRGQAEVLSIAHVLQNDYGTAPCQMIEKENKLLFCLPGVPFEVKSLIKEKVIPYLQERGSLPYILTKVVSVVGLAESLLAKKIEDWENRLPKNVKLSYLPVGTRIKLVLSAKGEERAVLCSVLDSAITHLKKMIGAHIISVGDHDTISDILKGLLLDKSLSLSVAESCTGGEISKQITSTPGCSAYYKGGICSYGVKQKTDLLGVPRSLIREFSVVSGEVASSMSLGCQKKFRTDIALSTTGVAGPNTGDSGAPVGRVYYSVRIGSKEKCHSLFLPHLEREDFQYFVSQKVLQTLVEGILDPNF
ncbi:MAG: CinA family nicotinamide mononucleotide deamidase-related protein [Bergeyella sp.]|nr:CinA family nicotinamide mononucleotide deamidase-related protein [Bergeyella sp.]